MARRDDQTLDMFPYPTEPVLLPGALDCDVKIRSRLARMLKSSPKDRDEVAAEVSRLMGRELSANMLDAYCAPSRTDWRLPACVVPALTVVLDHSLQDLMAELTGARLLIGKEALNAELGKLEKLRDDTSHRIRALKRAMGDNS